MSKRTSVVQYMDIDIVITSSILLVGDADYLTPKIRALAVQREAEFFYGNEGNFNAFPLFSKVIPPPPPDGTVRLQRRNESPFIHVDSIDIISFAGSSVGQIGSNRRIDAEARIKHIRQLLSQRHPFGT